MLPDCSELEESGPAYHPERAPPGTGARFTASGHDLGRAAARGVKRSMSSSRNRWCSAGSRRLHLPGWRWAFCFERDQRLHPLPYRRLNKGHLQAEHVRGLPAENGLFPHQTKEPVARYAQHYRVSDCDGRKAVWTSGECGWQAQQRPRRKYSIQSGQALDPKTYFSLAHQIYAEVFIAGFEQDISGWNLLRLTERFQGTLQFRRRIEDVRTVTHILH